MSGISTYASHRILDFLLGRQPFTLPSIFYLGVSTTPLGLDGVGATEPVDPAYRRLAISNDRVSFSVAANKITSLIKSYQYPIASVDWPRCTHYMIYDNNTGGNIWFYGELQNSINVQIDSCGIILANTNQFSFDICGGSTTDMTVTSYASNKILNYIFGNSPTLVMPANFYMGVSSTALNIEGIGATEPTGGGYQRLVIPNDKNSFSAAANKTVTFAKEFQFPNSTSPWGDMTHWFISDTPTGENVWWNGKLIHHRNVEISTTLSVIPNAFNWVLDTCGLAVTP